MIDMTLAKSIYNLGRVYALLERQTELTAEQALLFEELKSFRSKIVEIDYKLYGMFELGYLMERGGRFG